MISGTTIGFICVLALLAASILLVFLDRKEKRKGNVDQSRFLSRAALILFLAAFAGGVVVTLLSGVQSRNDGGGVVRRMSRSMGGGMGPNHPPVGGGEMMGAIANVDPQEIERLEAKVENDPKDVASRERLGHLYLQAQNFEGVFKMAHESLQVSPKSAESRVHMGMALFAMQDVDQALAQFDRALAIDPKNTEALLFKGIVLFQGRQDLPGAKEAWEKFLKVAKPNDPGLPRVKMFLGSIR